MDYAQLAFFGESQLKRAIEDLKRDPCWMENFNQTLHRYGFNTNDFSINQTKAIVNEIARAHNMSIDSYTVY